MNSLPFRLPRRRTRVPGWSRSFSQAWLNQTAVISPDSSATRAFTSWSRLARWTRTLSTSPAIAASSSPNRSEIANSGAAGS